MITSVETYTGQVVDLASPDPKTISIEDIAWHLSKLPRFLGATRHEMGYSVAQHSVLVMNRVRQTQPSPSKDLLVSALLRDAPAAYIGELVWAMKRLLDMRAPIERLEGRLRRAIWKGLMPDGFSPMDDHPAVSAASTWARSYEAHHLMHSKGRHWPGMVLLEDEHILRNVLVWDANKAYESFLNHYESLKY